MTFPRISDASRLLAGFAILGVLQIAAAVAIVGIMFSPVTWAPVTALAFVAGATSVGVVLFVVARQRERSLESLREEVSGLASQRLPDVLRSVVDRRSSGPSDLRLPVLTDPLLATLAGEFEEVCERVSRLASQHDEIHAGYAEVFLNMFRRTQTLLLRQLQIIERLEESNESPADLNRLFQLDHLVTRLRRNNENILLLSGTELVRKTKDPVPVADLLRASISEIDHYQRVTVLATPSVRVENTAAGDLIRIIAELLDNATAFSPPDKRVTVKAELGRHQGLSIGVFDNGIGMSDAEIGKANEQLRRLGSAEIARSRRVGLLVVGRLAGRHGVRVELFGGDNVAGVSALVSIPSSVLLEEDSVRAALPGDPTRGLTDAQRRSDRPGVPRTTMRSASVVPVTTTVRKSDAGSARKPKSATARTPEAAPDRKATSSVSKPTVGDEQGSEIERTRRLSAWHSRSKASAARSQPTEASEGRLRQSDRSAVVARAHADVPGELPTRVPNRARGSSGQAGVTAARRSASPWFRAKSTAPTHGTAEREAGEQGAPNAAESWGTSVDQAWRVVADVTHSAGYTYTEDGLPLRKQGEHLLPGGVERSPEASPESERKTIERDPRNTRRRLSSYQLGVQKAKEQESRMRRSSHSSGWTILERDS